MLMPNSLPHLLLLLPPGQLTLRRMHLLKAIFKLGSLAGGLPANMREKPEELSIGVSAYKYSFARCIVWGCACLGAPARRRNCTRPIKQRQSFRPVWNANGAPPPRPARLSSMPPAKGFLKSVYSYYNSLRDSRNRQVAYWFAAPLFIAVAK